MSGLVVVCRSYAKPSAPYSEEIERFLSGKNEVEICNDRLLLLGIQKVGEPPNTSSYFGVAY